MADGPLLERADATSLRRVVDRIFGRWPAWPWSVLGLVAAGGVGGLVAAPALRRAGVVDTAALGDAACAGYGIIVAALVSLLPRVGRLGMLWSGITRRPVTIDASWWPLDLLTAALATTPTLRRTPEEFAAAVTATVGRSRSLLADRLWPAWVVAFVAPVLGLITAWQNGSRVQLRLQQGEGMAAVFPALIAQVSPPMVGTIGASLVLMVTIVAIDQFTKAILRRWADVVEVADGERDCVVERLGGEELRDETMPPPPVAPAPAPKKLPTHPVDPDELDAMWRRSGTRDD
jgi:uncharacterized integral membrane protein